MQSIVKNFSLFVFFFIIPTFMVALEQKNYEYKNLSDYEIKIFSGENIKQILSFLITTYITYYREYPYLYEGDWEEISSYFTWLATLKSGAVAVAYHNGQPVGFLSATPFSDFDGEFTGSVELFRRAGLNPEDYYYFTEVIVVKEYRGHSLSPKLFAMMEEYGRRLNYSKACLVTESHEYHPFKPKNYKELNTLWMRLEYTKSQLSIVTNWDTIQLNEPAKDQEHVLTYWFKNLY